MTSLIGNGISFVGHIGVSLVIERDAEHQNHAIPAPAFDGLTQIPAVKTRPPLVEAAERSGQRRQRRARPDRR